MNTANYDKIELKLKQDSYRYVFFLFLKVAQCRSICVDTCFLFLVSKMGLNQKIYWTYVDISIGKNWLLSRLLPLTSFTGQLVNPVVGEGMEQRGWIGQIVILASFTSLEYLIICFKIKVIVNLFFYNLTKFIHI